jgi:hypothetical protein
MVHKKKQKVRRSEGQEMNRPEIYRNIQKCTEMYRNVPGVNAVDATACWDEQYPYSNKITNGKTKTQNTKNKTQNTSTHL